MTIKVKPLVWVRVQESRELGPEPYDHAEGFGGSYIVEHRAAGHFDMWKPNLSCGDRFALEAAAKAAAQAHHEAAVRSQIEEVDPAAIRAEALREAIAPQLSEGIGAILRKFCDSDDAAKARHHLHAMPDADWKTLIDMLADASSSAVLALIDKEQDHGR